MIIIFAAIIIVAGVVGAVVSRMCGGGKPVVPYGLDQFIYGLPYLLTGSGLWRLLSYAGAVLGKRLGHGQYMGLTNEHGDPAGDEGYDFIVSWFFGPETTQPARYWRNLFGMFLSGLWVVLVATIELIVFGHYLEAAIVFLGGALKAPAYMISTKLGYGTEGGEYLTGFFGWSSVAIAAIIMI